MFNYQGYYTTGNISINLFELLFLAKGSNPEIGDYLLINNVPNIYLYKYINNYFIEIIINNYLFYSIINDMIYKIELNTINEYSTITNNQIFNGDVGIILPGAASYSLEYFLLINLTNIESCLYKKISSAWFIIILGTFKYSYTSPNGSIIDKYIIYTQKNSKYTDKPIKLEYATGLYGQYHGFYTSKILDNTVMANKFYNNVISEITSLKGGVTAVVGDVLLCKTVDNIFRFYTIVNSSSLAKNDLGYPTIFDFSGYFLFTNYNNLEVLKVKSDGFDPNLKNGVFSETIALDRKFYGAISELVYRDDYAINGKYLLTTYSFMFYKYEDEMYVVLLCLYKFTFIVILENYLIEFTPPENTNKLIVIYDIVSGVNNYNVIIIVNTNINSVIGRYQGYYSSEIPIDIYFKILVTLKHSKQNQSINKGIINVGDVLLSLNANKTMIIISTIKVEDDDVVVPIETINNKIGFLYVSQKTNKNASLIITSPPTTFLILDFNFGSTIYCNVVYLNNLDNYSGISGDMVYNLYNKCLYFYYNGEWILIRTNNTKIKIYGENNYSINTDYDNNITINLIKNTLKYQGYYKNNIINNNQDVIDSIKTLSGLDEININDCLLAYNDNNILGYFKIIFINGVNVLIDFTQISENILYYNNNYVDNTNIRDILYINNLQISTFKQFDNQNTLLKGYTNKIYINKDNYYLNTETLELQEYNNNWIKSILNLHNYNFVNLETRAILNINVSNNIITNSMEIAPSLKNISKSNINEEYQGYYSNINLNLNLNNSTIDNILKELQNVKNGNPEKGDLLLILVNNIPTVYRVNSYEYKNITQITQITGFLFWDSITKKVYYVDNNQITETNEIFNKVLEGYLSNVYEPPQIIDKIYYVDLNNNTFYTWFDNKWVITLLGLYRIKYKFA